VGEESSGVIISLPCEALLLIVRSGYWREVGKGVLVDEKRGRNASLTGGKLARAGGAPMSRGR